MNKKHRLRRALGVLGLVLLGVLIAGMAGWSVLALLYFDGLNQTLRQGLAAGFAVAALTVLIALAAPRWRWRAVAGFFALFVLLLWRWFAIEPSNDRDWQADVARQPYATFAGDTVTVHNIRNFDYRTETDYTPGYYDKTFDLRQLDGVDLVASYWMGPTIAHVFLSFSFASKDHLAISIEARKSRDEAYSSIKGFFRQYELYYLISDERDVIRLRTNYRRDPPEDVYLYRVNTSPENAQRLFLSYLSKVNSLRDTPEFYNSLTTNCTSNIWVHAGVNPGRLPYSWKILLSGYVPEYLYENGRLDTSVPFDELTRRAHINARAQAADQDADFSQRIREPGGP